MKGGITILLLTLVFAQSPVAFGQTTGSVGIHFSHDSNSYRTYDAVPDYVTETSFSIARDMMADPWTARLFYDGNLSFFSENSDRRFQDHTMGLAFSRPFPWNDALLAIGGNFSLSRNAALYEYADYTQGLGYVNAKFSIGQASANQLGYRLRYRGYENLPVYSYLENYVFERVNFSFSSGTSLILQTSYGRKSYSAQSSSSAAPPMPADGHGHMGGENRGGEDGGDYWWGSSGDSASLVPSASQWTGSMRVGQSITASTGVGVYYLRRANLGGNVRPSYPYGELYSYSPEDELFNDPYSYEGHELGAELTRLLPWQMSAKLGYDHYIKNYSYPARDLAGEPLASGRTRSDTQDVVRLNLSKTFSGGSAIDGFHVTTELLTIANESNDPYFDYDDTVITFGTGLSF
jgi:hypothetical protein